MAKSFRQASTFINVEESVIVSALQWLADHQASNGSFPEVGKVHHTEMQGGSTYELALTAYTLIAFLENSKTTQQFRNTITRSIEYVVRNLYRITDDSYALALCTYALHLAEHPEKDSAFNTLESNAQGNGKLLRQSFDSASEKSTRVLAWKFDLLIWKTVCSALVAKRCL